MEKRFKGVQAQHTEDPGARTRKVGSLWSDQAEKRVAECGASRLDWSVSPAIMRVINRRTSGSEERNWLGWLKDEIAEEPLELGLSIGCGTGLIEKEALENGVCAALEGVDIAEGALEVARAQNAGLPVEYRKVDLEHESLPRGRYDIVLASGALHHIGNLEFCVAELHSALKDGGLLALMEFKGPARFQWSETQLEMISCIYSFLPPGHRFNHTLPGYVPFARRPDVCAMVTGDPSEAVRSDEMLEVIERWFEPVSSRQVGGTILNPLLGGILENFDEADEADLSYMLLAAVLEEMLVEEGALPSDFVSVIYRRRAEPLAHYDPVDRSALVRRQEAEIEQLVRRYEELKLAHEELSGEVEAARLAAGETGALVAALQLENAGLKRGPVFGCARLARRLAGRGGTPTRPSGAQPFVSTQVPPHVPGENASLLPVPIPVVHPGPPAARWVSAYCGRLTRGTALTWVTWLGEALGVRADRALMVSVEPSEAQLAKAAGICEEFDIASVNEATGALEMRWPADSRPPALYDLVILDVTSYGEDISTAAGAAASAVSPSGTMAVLTHARPASAAERARLRRLMERVPVGRVSRDETAEKEEPRSDNERLAVELIPGLFLQGRWGMCGHLREAAVRTLGRGEASPMEAALSRLLLYGEQCLIDNGLLPPVLWLSVYARGTPRTRGATAGRADIVSAQAAEIARLERLVEAELAHGAGLAGELSRESENESHVARDLQRLIRERDILRRKGPSRYGAFLKERLSGRAR